MGPSPSESVSAEGAKCHIIRDERKTDPSFDIISSNPYNYAYDVGRLILIWLKFCFCYIQLRVFMTIYQLRKIVCISRKTLYTTNVDDII